MVGSTTVGTRSGGKRKGIVAAVLLALGMAWTGQALAQPLLPVKSAGHPAKGHSDKIRAQLSVGRKKAAPASQRQLPAMDEEMSGQPVPMSVAMPVATVAADAVLPWDIMLTDKTLNATMARWAAAAGWQLLWELPVDYAVQSRTQVTGTFEEAVIAVVHAMETSEIPLKAVFYDGNKVLRILPKGSEQ